MVLDECLPEPLRADPRRHSHPEEDLEEVSLLVPEAERQQFLLFFARTFAVFSQSDRKIAYDVNGVNK